MNRRSRQDGLKASAATPSRRVNIGGVLLVVGAIVLVSGVRVALLAALTLMLLALLLLCGAASRPIGLGRAIYGLITWLATFVAAVALLASGAWLWMVPESRPAWMLSDAAEVNVCTSVLLEEKIPSFCHDWEERRILVCEREAELHDSEPPCSTASIKACEVSLTPLKTRAECRKWWMSGRQP